MARRPLPLLVPSPHGEHQKYACRDCPARCCKTWGVQLSSEEAERIARDPEAVARLSGRAPQILAGGKLPMRERAGELACVFLDDDDLCSLHKRHGHAFLPRACQAYPFGVSQNEAGAEVALLSRYCPSIAQNYGDPVGQVLAQQRKHLDPPRPLSARMGLRSGRTLPLSQYIAVVEAWRRELASSTNLARSLARLFALTEAVDQALPSQHAPSDQEFTPLLASADQATPHPDLTVKRQKWGARVLVAHLLGALCRPLRLMQPFNLAPVTLGQHVR
ncbi:MAG TPA: YkgJ family cysteine cluster protein, partial [Polyangiaceae bacterium]|nr:YkgJ family cysteine cluster protein [Polyangiaceae bacterium]